MGVSADSSGRERKTLTEGKQMFIAKRIGAIGTSRQPIIATGVALAVVLAAGLVGTGFAKTAGERVVLTQVLFQTCGHFREHDRLG